MKRKGINFTPAPHLSWRPATPSDCRTDGRPIEPNYVVIIKTKDCLGKDGQYDETKRSSAPMHGTVRGHSRTNMVYSGVYRKKSRPRHFDNVLYFEYWTSPVYWVENNRVYQATRATPVEPN